MAGDQVNSRNKRNAYERQKALRAQEKRQRRLLASDPNTRTEVSPPVFHSELSAGLSAAEIAERIASGGTGSRVERTSPSRRYRGKEKG